MCHSILLSTALSPSLSFTLSVSQNLKLKSYFTDGIIPIKCNMYLLAPPGTWSLTYSIYRDNPSRVCVCVCVWD